MKLIRYNELNAPLSLARCRVVTGGAQAVASDARGVGRTKDLESFLKLMISRRGDARRATMHVSNADLSLLQKCTRVAGGNLVGPWMEQLDLLVKWREGKSPGA